jgi:hypothetical protein
MKIFFITPAATLAETSEELLKHFPPMGRAVILAVKEYLKVPSEPQGKAT